MVFVRIKKARIQFPRLWDCSSFLPEIWCETAEYDDHNRSIRYRHPETQPDDTLHSINYAAVLARMTLEHRLVYGCGSGRCVGRIRGVQHCQRREQQAVEEELTKRWAAEECGTVLHFFFAGHISAVSLSGREQGFHDQNSLYTW